MRGYEKGNKNFIWFIIFMGAIGGSFIGDVLGNTNKALEFLKNTYYVGTSNPFVLDLKVMAITLGIKFNINIMTVVGIIVSIILYRKL